MKMIMWSMAVAASVAFLAFSAPANAACQWKWDCTAGAGQCRQVPLCDHTFDVAPPRPPQVPPIPSPSIAPVHTPTVPPVGTTQCHQEYLCDAGQCRWTRVCE